MIGLKWKGLQVDRPLAWDEIAEKISYDEKANPCMIRISFELIAGKTETTFTASLDHSGEAASEREHTLRSWTLAPDERKSAGFFPLRCRLVLGRLFAPTTSPVTLTIRVGERVLHRSEVRREAFEGLTVSYATEHKRAGGHSLNAFRTDPPLQCDALPRVATLGFDLFSDGGGEVHVLPLSPGQIPHAAPSPPRGPSEPGISAEMIAAATGGLRTYPMEAPGLSVPPDACRRFPRFTVTSREDRINTDAPTRPDGSRPTTRGKDQPHSLRFTPDKLRLLFVDRTGER